jgi:GH15 family glucan-1,4-alpha-glucosidase
MPSRIEDYALIGDCETGALVAREGSIDWLCWPRFDSDACFAALLGLPEHGRWLIAPRDVSPQISRRYRGDTLILETLFETADGAVRLIDFMPPQQRNSSIVRIVAGERGEVAMHTELVLRFGYGDIVPWVTRLDDKGIRAVAGPDMALLHSPVKVRGEDMKTVGDFTVRAGQTEHFVLTYGPSHLPAPHPVDPLAALTDTKKFWTEWVQRCRMNKSCPEPVVRSLITLKALTYAPTGGIVAAASTSLPEKIGGKRNWDYRYCWLRDSTLTLLAFMDAGYFEEAHAWRDWLQRAVAGRPDQTQIVYGIAGERRLAEWEVPWLPGYEGSAPVRVGNHCHQQLQIDVYGEIMDTFHQARMGGLAASESGWAVQIELLKCLEAVWSEPDAGIWEVRGARQHFTYSKVMAWVAFDRAIRSAEKFKLPGSLDRWRVVRDAIHEDVCQHGFDADLGSFVQSYERKELDASLLLIPAVGFLPAHDKRVLGTIKAIERHLMVDGFVLRYDSEKTADGLPPGEGAFLACSFWLVDAYILLKRYEDAQRLFKRLVSLRNDVGLLAEEYDPVAGRQLGNFPQAFSHLALVNSAMNLMGRTKPTRQRANQRNAVGAK